MYLQYLQFKTQIRIHFDENNIYFTYLFLVTIVFSNSNHYIHLIDLIVWIRILKSENFDNCVFNIGPIGLGDQIIFSFSLFLDCSTLKLKCSKSHKLPIDQKEQLINRHFQKNIRFENINLNTVVAIWENKKSLRITRVKIFLMF